MWVEITSQSYMQKFKKKVWHSSEITSSSTIVLVLINELDMGKGKMADFAT